MTCGGAGRVDAGGAPSGRRPLGRTPTAATRNLARPGRFGARESVARCARWWLSGERRSARSRATRVRSAAHGPPDRASGRQRLRRRSVDPGLAGRARTPSSLRGCRPRRRRRPRWLHPDARPGGQGGGWPGCRGGRAGERGAARPRRRSQPTWAGWRSAGSASTRRGRDRWTRCWRRLAAKRRPSPEAGCAAVAGRGTAGPTRRSPTTGRSTRRSAVARRCSFARTATSPGFPRPACGRPITREIPTRRAG